MRRRPRLRKVPYDRKTLCMDNTFIITRRSGNFDHYAICRIRPNLSYLRFMLGLDDDSDASSVCSISTCPDDLVRRRDTHHRPRMPIFSDTETGNVNYSTKSTSAQKSVKKFRPRPTGFQGKYRLCRYHTSKQRCFQGERCPYPHSEEERKAWEEERNKGCCCFQYLFQVFNRYLKLVTLLL